jgi:vesicular inhibitory amino acid transporter
MPDNTNKSSAPGSTPSSLGRNNSISIPGNSSHNYGTLGRASNGHLNQHFREASGFSSGVGGGAAGAHIVSRGRINSFGHFASSFTRAQSFLAIDPPNDLTRARSFFVDDESNVEAGLQDETSSLIAHQYHTGSRRPSFSARYFAEHSASAVDDDDYSVFEDESIISGFPGSLKPGSFLASMPRRTSYLPPPERGTIVLHEGEAIAPGTETEPVIIRQVEGKDGKITTIVAGQSTAPQTIFNSVNVLVGIGLLSLSLGFKYSGWLIGIAMLIFAAISTFYSAKLLSKCMDTDPTLVTYADIAYAAFGPKARVLTSILFTLELAGSGVSLVVLFADSLNALFPQFSRLQYKLLAFLILTPPCFLPLRVLSVSSIMGIMSTFGLVLIVLFDGLWKQEGPGSLIHPMETWILPRNWMAVPLSVGIFMSPWGGHAVFPNIYRDMRHPHKYEKCLVTTYQITFFIDISMGILGFLMFGAGVSEEVTKSILLTPGYPKPLGLLITALIAVIPLAKTPLNARPIVSTLDILLGLDHVPMSFEGTMQGHISAGDIFLRGLKVLLRIAVVFFFVLFAIVFPSFDRIIALVGSSLCITICIIGPVGFYLSIFRDEVSRSERLLCYFLLVVFSCMALLGTVWCFLSPETIQNGFNFW